MMRRLKGIILIAVIVLSLYVASVPPILADIVVDHASFPPDFPGDVDYNGKVDIKDVYKVIQHYGATFGSSGWDARYDLNDDGITDVKDVYAVDKLYGRTYSSTCVPVAYSTDVEFGVPFDGDETVWYYMLVRIYVPPELSQSVFIFVEDSVNDWVLNVKIDNQLEYTGSTSDTPCQVRNVTLGNLNQGFHLLEFYFVEKWAAGYVRFHIRTADGGYAWLDRFRIYVPNNGDDEVGYTVRTHTYFPGDDFFLGGFANDYIDDIIVDAGLVWQDWMWDMGPSYGAIYAWSDGFMYPLGWQDTWRNITFTFGEKWGSGLLDFQYISRTLQPDKIGKPKFWTQVSATEASPYLKIFEAKAWTGSEWLQTPGTSMRTIATTVEVLVNTTDTETFYPAPQDARVSLTLYNLSTLYPTYSYQDIGVVVNLTYTYFVEGSPTYGMPILFYPYSVEVELAEQGSMLYMPNPSLVFFNQTHTSFVTSEWKFAFTVLNSLIGAMIGDTLGGGLAGKVGGAATGLWSGYNIDQVINFAPGQVINWTTEGLNGSPTSRNFTMYEFRTTRDQLPPGLSPVVGNVCSGFVFHVLPFSSGHCGLISIDLKGYLYLPFFYKHPGLDPGTYLPIEVDIHTMFPIFVQ